MGDHGHPGVIAGKHICPYILHSDSHSKAAASAAAFLICPQHASGIFFMQVHKFSIQTAYAADRGTPQRPTPEDSYAFSPFLYENRQIFTTRNPFPCMRNIAFSTDS
jgi:hypothetical protein